MASFRSIGAVLKHTPNLQLLSRSAPSTRFASSKKGKSKGATAADQDSCKKIASSLPSGGGAKKKCDKVKGIGCAPRARENCDMKPKKRGPCDRLQVPQACYSECVKEPPPWHGMSECPTLDKGPPLHCIKPRPGISIDGCNPPPKPALEPDCRPRNIGPRPPNRPCDPCDATQKKPFKSGK